MAKFFLFTKKIYEAILAPESVLKIIYTLICKMLLSITLIARLSAISQVSVIDPLLFNVYIKVLFLTFVNFF